MNTMSGSKTMAALALAFVACGGEVEGEPIVLDGGSGVFLPDVAVTRPFDAGHDAVVTVHDSGGDVTVVDAIVVDAVVSTPDVTRPPPEAAPDAACGALLGLEVSPFSVDINAFCSTQLHAIASFEGCSSVDVTTEATWASPETSAVTVGASTGLVQAAPNTNFDAVDITATFMGLTGAATVEITSTGIQRLLVSPAMASISVGGTITFAATGLLDDGTSCDLTNTASWFSQSGEIAPIEAMTGVATGVAAGMSLIGAVVDQQEGTAELTVTP